MIASPDCDFLSELLCFQSTCALVFLGREWNTTRAFGLQSLMAETGMGVLALGFSLPRLGWEVTQHTEEFPLTSTSHLSLVILLSKQTSKYLKKKKKDFFLLEKKIKRKEKKKKEKNYKKNLKLAEREKCIQMPK